MSHAIVGSVFTVSAQKKKNELIWRDHFSLHQFRSFGGSVRKNSIPFLFLVYFFFSVSLNQSLCADNYDEYGILFIQKKPYLR